MKKQKDVEIKSLNVEHMDVKNLEEELEVLDVCGKDKCPQRSR